MRTQVVQPPRGLSVSSIPIRMLPPLAAEGTGGLEVAEAYASPASSFSYAA